jgi:hypothetical protein
MFQAIDKEWEAFLNSQSSTNDARMLPILYQSSSVTNMPKLSSLATDNNIEEFEDEISLESVQQEAFDDSVFDVEIDKNKIPETMPECSKLHISTKTNVLYLNQPIDIATVFWNIPCIEYWRPVNGVIKKQMKIVSNSLEEFAAYQEKLKGIKYYTETCIKQKNNPNARKLKFKDDRKITVGVSKRYNELSQ